MSLIVLSWWHIVSQNALFLQVAFWQICDPVPQCKGGHIYLFAVLLHFFWWWFKRTFSDGWHQSLFNIIWCLSVFNIIFSPLRWLGSSTSHTKAPTLSLASPRVERFSIQPSSSMLDRKFHQDSSQSCPHLKIQITFDKGPALTDMIFVTSSTSGASVKYFWIWS